MTLDKSCQCSDWARRPLTAAQVRYAAADAASLVPLRAALAAHAATRGDAGVISEVEIEAKPPAAKATTAAAAAASPAAAPAAAPPALPPSGQRPLGHLDAASEDAEDGDLLHELCVELDTDLATLGRVRSGALARVCGAAAAAGATTADARGDGAGGGGRMGSAGCEVVSRGELRAALRRYRAEGAEPSADASGAAVATDEAEAEAEAEAEINAICVVMAADRIDPRYPAQVPPPPPPLYSTEALHDVLHDVQCWCTSRCTARVPWRHQRCPAPSQVPLLLLLPAGTRVELRWLALVLGARRRNLRLASAAECVLLFGAAPGCVPPVPLRPGALL